MERKVIKRIIKFNLIITSLIILDLAISGKEQEIKELNSIYSFTQVSGNGRSRTADEKVILELTNGERYRIGRFPNKEYNQGTKIIVFESYLSNNVNVIKIFDNEWKKINVGLFSNLAILAFFLLSIATTILNIYFYNKALNIGLVLSMMFIGIISIIYNFVY